jgi:hypothetical protein
MRTPGEQRQFDRWLMTAELGITALVTAAFIAALVKLFW